MVVTETKITQYLKSGDASSAAIPSSELFCQRRRMAIVTELHNEEDEAKFTAPQSTQSPQQPPLRTFSWSYWLILTTIAVTLASYFKRRSQDVKAVASSPVSVLDAQLGFTPHQAYETLRTLGPEGRKIYREINRVDFVIVPVGLREYLLATMPARSYYRESVREMFANIYGFGDLLENICVAIMLKSFPLVNEYLAWTCCAGNVAKYIGFYGAAFMVLLEVLLWVHARVSGS
jgi:hypothetical protein